MATIQNSWRMKEIFFATDDENFGGVIRRIKLSMPQK